MSELFFENITEILVQPHKSKETDFFIKYNLSENDRIINLEYNLNCRKLSLSLKVAPNIDLRVLHYILDIIEGTKKDNIDYLHELIKDWFDVTIKKNPEDLIEVKREYKKIL